MPRLRALALAALACGLLAAGPPARAADSVPPDAGREYWQQRAREVHAQYRRAAERHQRALDAYSSMRSRQHLAGDAKAAVIAELEAAEKALAEAERELEAFPEEARRAGALPGWIRLPESDPASAAPASR